MEFVIYTTLPKHFLADDDTEIRPCQNAVLMTGPGSREREQWHWEVELSDLQALAALQQEVKSKLIIDFREPKPIIEIYNSYRE